MKNGRTVPRTPTLGRSLRVPIVIGLCCYVLMLGVVELTHDHHHEHDDHAEDSHSGEACAACFYCSQNVGEEMEFLALIFPFLPDTVLPLYEISVFLPLRLTTNTRSRAPPVFSNELQIF